MNVMQMIASDMKQTFMIKTLVIGKSGLVTYLTSWSKELKQKFNDQFINLSTGHILVTSLGHGSRPDYITGHGSRPAIVFESGHQYMASFLKLFR